MFDLQKKLVMLSYGILMLSCLACEAPSLKEAEPPRQDFTNGLNIHLDAIISKNLSKFESTLSHKLPINMIFPDGEMVQNVDTILHLHQEWFASEGWKLDYKILRKEVTTEMAYALLDIDYTKKDEEGSVVLKQFYLNLVFKLVDGKWKLIHDQNTLHS